MGPRSPLSQAHLLWAKGHFKHRKRVSDVLHWRREWKECKIEDLPLHLPVLSVDTQEWQYQIYTI